MIVQVSNLLSMPTPKTRIPSTTFRPRDRKQHENLRRLSFKERKSVNTLLQLAADALIEERLRK